MFYFYIFRCKDGTLYCGSTKDIHRREQTHNSGRGSKYVRSRGGGQIIYHEKFKTLSQALKREAEVKRWNRTTKMKLISANPHLSRLWAGHPLPSADVKAMADKKGEGNNVGGMKRPQFAAIFDMDGVLADNSVYHFKSWAAIARQFGVKLTLKHFNRYMNGRRAEDNIRHVAEGRISAAEIKRLAAEKERVYRRAYRKHIKPVKGLLEFLTLLKKRRIKIGMATSAPAVNVNFVLARTGTRKFFIKIINSAQVTKGKPDPQVYLKTAKLMGAKPKNCVVFEDALNGIEAARRAGMKVVALATTNPAKYLRHADLVIKDFRGLTVERLAGLFK